jgi:hypothetical protein
LRILAAVEEPTMLRIFDSGGRSGRLHRRELLRIGGLNALGLSLPALLGRQTDAAADVPAPLAATFGRARSCIFLWLQGGPPQHETFDPKPDAPSAIRGEFKPIATNVPGIDFCELLPRTARIADKLAIVRSMSTRNDLHDASGYWILTGYRYNGAQSRQISPTDWPYFGSIVRKLKPSESMPALTSVWLPDVMRLNDNVQPAGQTAGFLGKRWDPERLIGDPSAPGYRVEGLTLPGDVPPLRLQGRRSLLAQINEHLDRIERSAALDLYGRQAQDAFSLLGSGAARAAFDLGREPAAVRARYGPGRWAPCLLLARRLVEAGVRLVHVNWPREGGDEAVDNPMWDTHAQNSDRLQDVLCPQFDVGFTALVDDLEARGLLAETLVVAIGEFGRTPKINNKGGRDHWGHVFSFALAGAGIRTAQVHGSSDAHGAYPRSDRVEPQDLTATLFHLLGIRHDGFFTDQTDRPRRVTEGDPIRALLGSGAVTERRRRPEGNPTLVPAFNSELLLNTGFQDDVPLTAIGAGGRIRGWQAEPVATGAGFGVRIVGDPAGRRCLHIGFKPGAGALAPQCRALLAQEVRHPMAGRYTLSVRTRATGTGEGRAILLDAFSFRLVLFGYRDLKKDPRQVREFASLPFRPADDGSPSAFSVVTTLKSQDGGAFQLSQGVGVAVVVERRAPGALELAPTAEASLQIDAVELAFDPRPRNDDVTV